MAVLRTVTVGYAARFIVVAIAAILLAAFVAPPARAASVNSIVLADRANSERASRDIKQLRRSEALDKVALNWAKKMASTAGGKCAISSTSLRHNSNLKNQVPSGWRKIGENVGCGYKASGPAGMVNAWMNSDGHRRNILDKDYNHIGVGYYVDDTGMPWAVQVFAKYNTAQSKPSEASVPAEDVHRPEEPKVAIPRDGEDSSSDEEPANTGAGSGTTANAPKPAPSPRSSTGTGAPKDPTPTPTPTPTPEPTAEPTAEPEPTKPEPDVAPSDLVRTVVDQVRDELNDLLAALGR